MMTSLVGDSEKNLHLPLLLGGWPHPSYTALCFFIAPLHAEAHAKLKEDLERREVSTEATTSFQDGRYKETPIRIETNVK